MTTGDVSSDEDPWVAALMTVPNNPQEGALTTEGLPQEGALTAGGLPQNVGSATTGGLPPNAEGLPQSPWEQYHVADPASSSTMNSSLAEFVPLDLDFER